MTDPTHQDNNPPLGLCGGVAGGVVLQANKLSRCNTQTITFLSSVYAQNIHSTTQPPPPAPSGDPLLPLACPTNLKPSTCPTTSPPLPLTLSSLCFHFICQAAFLQACSVLRVCLKPINRPRPPPTQDPYFPHAFQSPPPPTFCPTC